MRETPPPPPFLFCLNGSAACCHASLQPQLGCVLMLSYWSDRAAGWSCTQPSVHLWDSGKPNEKKFSELSEPRPSAPLSLFIYGKKLVCELGCRSAEQSQFMSSTSPICVIYKLTSAVWHIDSCQSVALYSLPPLLLVGPRPEPAVFRLCGSATSCGRTGGLLRKVCWLSLASGWEGSHRTTLPLIIIVYE